VGLQTLGQNYFILITIHRCSTAVGCAVVTLNYSINGGFFEIFIAKIEDSIENIK